MYLLKFSWKMISIYFVYVDILIRILIYRIMYIAILVRLTSYMLMMFDIKYGIEMYYLFKSRYCKYFNRF